MPEQTALIVGVGDGLSASLARRLKNDGFKIALASRNTAKLDALASQTNASVHSCDASNPEAVTELFDAVDSELGVVVYNPSARVRGALVDLDAEAVRKAVEITAFGAFLVGQAAARRMLAQPARGGVHGTILFTGASAGVKGFAKSASFAMGKFAQRGLAQSMSRELHPHGVHVCWVNIDGGIGPAGGDPARLDPDAIADSYAAIVQQPRSAWSNELALRPSVETF